MWVFQLVVFFFSVLSELDLVSAGDLHQLIALLALCMLTLVDIVSVYNLNYRHDYRSLKIHCRCESDLLSR